MVDENKQLNINNNIFNEGDKLINLEDMVKLCITCLFLFCKKIINIFENTLNIKQINPHIINITNKLSNYSIILQENNNDIKKICFRTKKYLLEQKKYDIEKYLLNLSNLHKIIFDENHI